MTATYDLTDNIGKVRLLIGDTDVTPASDAHFTDEEISAFLTMADDSVNIAAAIALEAWASTLSSNAESERIGDYSYSKKEASNKLTLAERLRNNEANTPASDWSEMDLVNFEDDTDSLED